MKYSELKRHLSDEGCFVVRQGGNHEIWYSPKTGRSFPLCRHNTAEVYVVTLKKIINQSGINL